MDALHEIAEKIRQAVKVDRVAVMNWRLFEEADGIDSLEKKSEANHEAKRIG
jgi:hypothetical protein